MCSVSRDDAMRSIVWTVAMRWLSEANGSTRQTDRMTVADQNVEWLAMACNAARGRERVR